MTNYTDAIGHVHDTAGRSGRIVSLVPSLTEALFAFGVGQRVVGITRYCVEPTSEVVDIPKVGGTKNVDVNAVLALKPDLVIANVEENSREDIERLVDAGANVLVTYPRTVLAAIDELHVLADLTGAKDQAAEALADAASELRTAPRHPGVRVFCPIWRRPWMTIGPDTYIHDVIRVCGGENIYGDATDRYPEVRLADVRAREPQIVLLPDEPFRFRPKHAQEVIDELGPIRIYFVDGKDLCWYGPRIASAIRSLGQLLQGDSADSEL